MMPSWRAAVARHLAATQPARLPQHAPVAAIRLA
jgi:hypothetical protein